jgi:glycosyltransferase involved in cell wall biosynthesis
VLLFTDADAFAGTERHILDLAQGLAGADVTVRIACPDTSPLAKRARASGHEVVPIEKCGTFDRPAIRTLTGLLKSGEINIVHAHNGRTALSAALAVTLNGRGRCVVSQHFIHPSHVSRTGLSGTVSRLAHLWVNRRVHRFIAVSQAVHRGALDRCEANPERLRVVPNGIWPVDTSGLTPTERIRSELGVPTGAPLIVSAARLEPEKDLATLVRAMQSVGSSEPAAVCAIAGEGSQAELLRELIRTNRLQDRVKLLGFRTDALSLIRAADLFVLPSLEEPAGLVLLEAMAMARPIVASRSGGPLEIVQDGESGLLVTPGDSDALAGAIGRLLQSPSSCREMGMRGYTRFREQFTAQRMARMTVDVYHQALA